MNNNNFEIQIQDVIDPLKGMIAEQCYQTAYAQGMVKSLERQVMELNRQKDALEQENAKLKDEIETLKKEI